MNVSDLNTTAGREYCAKPSKQDDDHHAIHSRMARSISIAVIVAALGTEWYVSATYGNLLDFLFGFGQILCVIGLLYGLVLSVVHWEHARTVDKSEDLPIDKMQARALHR